MGKCLTEDIREIYIALTVVKSKQGVQIFF